VNDLAMCGARPRWLSAGFILEEGLSMETLWQVVQSMQKAARSAGVEFVTGDTKVVDRGKGDQVFINTTGIGQVHDRADIAADRVRLGDKIIVSGNLAAHGVAIMSVREGLEFETTIASDTQPLHEPVLALLDEFGPAIHLLRDPTRGGVATVLTELARDAGCGIHIHQRLLPIDEQVAGACEILGLDPLYVANEGLFLAIVAADAAEAVLQRLRTFDAGAQACIIGEVVAEHPRQVVLTSGIGGRRVVSMLVGEQLPRIC
jgi:hydrogenase expression/formation protein HypE